MDTKQQLDLINARLDKIESMIDSLDVPKKMTIDEINRQTLKELEFITSRNQSWARIYTPWRFNDQKQTEL